ncbi:MAG: hypothetical protein F6J96_27960 [Symploca sp. SIO1C2]|nr:hypothetical protein [Symploca sp. SIO1C2]
MAVLLVIWEFALVHQASALTERDDYLGRIDEAPVNVVFATQNLSDNHFVDELRFGPALQKARARFDNEEVERNSVVDSDDVSHEIRNRHERINRTRWRRNGNNAVDRELDVYGYMYDVTHMRTTYVRSDDKHHYFRISICPRFEVLGRYNPNDNINTRVEVDRNLSPAALPAAHIEERSIELYHWQGSYDCVVRVDEAKIAR